MDVDKIIDRNDRLKMLKEMYQSYDFGKGHIYLLGQGSGQGQRLSNTLALPLSRYGNQAVKTYSVLLLGPNCGFFNRHPSFLEQGCCLGWRSRFVSVRGQIPHVKP